MGCKQSKAVTANADSSERNLQRNGSNQPKSLQQTASTNPNLKVLHNAAEVESTMKQIEKMAPRKRQSGEGKFQIASAEVLHPFQVEYAFVSQTGYYPGELLKPNQDTVGVTESMEGCNDKDLNEHCMFSVYDGHGKFGDICSQFAEQNMEHAVRNSEAYAMGNYKGAMEAGFNSVNDGLHAFRGGKCDVMSGTTAICVFFDGRTIHVANVGDSRAILGTRSRKGAVLAPADSSFKSVGSSLGDGGSGGKWSPRAIAHDREQSFVMNRTRRSSTASSGSFGSFASQTKVVSKGLVTEPLSLDQTPFRKDERERVKKCGARIMTMDQIEGFAPINENFGTEEENDGDPPRLWCQQGKLPGTAFTRSIGDRLAEKIGVTAQPEVVSRRLTEHDEFIILASDGVFEFLSSQAVIDIAEAYSSPLEACKALVSESYRLWLQYEVRTDDISCVVIRLKNIFPKADTLVTEPMVESQTMRNLMLQGVDRPVRRKLARVKQNDVAFNLEGYEKELENYELPSYDKTPDEVAEILHAVRTNFLFQHLSEAQLHKAIMAMEAKLVSEGEVVIRQFDEGDKFYVANTGEYDVMVAHVRTEKDEQGRVLEVAGEYDNPVHVMTYDCNGDANACFGDLALMYSKPRAATIIAKTRGKLWSLERKAFRSVLMKTNANDLIKSLRKVDLLKDMQPAALQRLADLLSEESFEDGQYVCRQGEPGDTFYVVVKGEARVTLRQTTDDVIQELTGAEDSSHHGRGMNHEPPPEEKQVMILKAFNYFGERALLHDAPRAANVIAGPGPLHCLSIKRSAFEEVLGPFEEYIERHRIERERRASEKAPRLQRASSLAMDHVTNLHDLRVTKAGFYSTEACFQLNTVFLKGNFKSKSGTLKWWNKKDLLLNKNAFSLAQNEKDVLMHLPVWEHESASGLPKLVSFWQDDLKLYSLFKLGRSVDLELFFSAQNQLSLEEVQFVLLSVMSAQSFLHTEGILHRSLLPEIIVLDEEGRCQLVDFRFSKKANFAQCYTVCGTPEYMSPEQVTGVGHGLEADWWSAGVLAFELVNKRTPFAKAENDENMSAMQVYEKIAKFDPSTDLNSPILDNYPELKDFVSALLAKDLAARLGSSEITLDNFDHPFAELGLVEGIRTGQAASPLRDRVQELLSDPALSQDAPAFKTSAFQGHLSEEDQSVFQDWGVISASNFAS